MKVLTVYDPAQVPHETIADFLHWYDLTMEFVEDRDYDSTTGTAEVLLPWLAAAREKYPPKVDGADNTTRYIIGSTYIYARFGEDVAEQAFVSGQARAHELGLGTYIAGSGETRLPDGTVVA
ncbi:MAG TPA: hypothetical protein VFC72_00670 [Corynebacterium sp.]|nr:hypothetical protein [Corynebacterium sp.]